MRLKVEAPWRFVGAREFEELLKRYPRELTVEPSLERKARLRNYSDSSLGAWPKNVIATANVGRSGGIILQVRTDIADWRVHEAET